jgi:hypothetical protein
MPHAAALVESEAQLVLVPTRTPAQITLARRGPGDGPT